LAYHFLDESLERGYKKEINTRKLSGVLSSLAIFIACLGLLGLTAYSLQRRIKEVAIRKILGAGVISLLNLLSKEHFKLIVTGLAIGVPMAVYWSQVWLEDYAYRVETPWWLYAIPGVTFTIITFITISRISIRTVKANPVDYLRDE
jgi:putative ABC transport system permease protein